ncbi:hypothetical protein GLAREA_03005 [Glarea lozoyensis ATCC 20868]|uniref:Uncharacterized protein n=1 Tax=Glarea lozoyensis (strain ATCC 20868 / MF5171) TaxID=1116229 RepID=S3D4T3_GLAL2|nr:uncharacterized protein GLAREA_03005 [Glarea lozoyensis ATCC 20868]EPE27091.1 hypothetical protein GLAREA_03005 [Glarea lozoyensis ATCC 20868]
MHTSLLIIAAAAASVVCQTTSSQPLPAATNLPLGSNCDPSLDNACANGADCYATNLMLMPRCGNFQAACTSDSQCAFNTCTQAQGLCNGFLSTSSTSAVSSTSSTAAATSSRTVTASSNSPSTDSGLPLGADCNPAVPNGCANGANCYATNSMLIPRCGNFQASCTTDVQCAFNTCNKAQGLCNGFLSTSNSATSASSPASTTISPTSTGLPLGSICSPEMEDACANGVECYATNSMLIPVCGNFQASCSSDSQCAFNTCVAGFCSGLRNTTTTNNTTTSRLPASTTNQTVLTTVNVAASPTSPIIQTTANIPTTTSISGNSTIAPQPSGPSSTGPIIANDGSEMARSVAGLLAVAALVALAL